MLTPKIPCQTQGLLMLLFAPALFLSLFWVPDLALAQSAKQQYMAADSCYKRLRNTPVRRQTASAWLNCINRYESIYQSHPKSSWAPAGMYKASELYLKLSRLSNNLIYKDRARDLLARIKNNYPKSAYSGRARILQKSIAVHPDHLRSPVRHIKSRKQATRNNRLIEKFNRAQSISPSKNLKTKPAGNATAKKSFPDEKKIKKNTAPRPASLKRTESSMEDEGGDARVTSLRFWSNPEYTRIVINASQDRTYGHRLLKKDPSINKPFQRLYVDIDQAKLANGVAEHTPINDNLLSQARAGQYLPHTVRVVVDIKSFENYKIFSLKDPFRIVIDVWGKGSNGGGPKADPRIEARPDGSPPHKTARITTENLKSSDIARQLALGVKKIVIDPGHGGPDPGAPGYIKGVWEKDIVLKLATNLAEKLRDRLGCTVVLTRSKDRKLTLEERTAIANTERADLFISLHCNAARNKNLAGFETYILNLATDDQAIAVAARENATSKKNISDLEYILSDLMKHAKIEESTRLASDVHKSMVKGMSKKHSKINDLGVKQAPFYVLLGARMPSILIETSFISNKRECKRLMTKSYRDDICNAITDGVEKYINATNPRQL